MATASKKCSISASAPAAACSSTSALGCEPRARPATEIRTIYDLLDVVRVRPGMWIGDSHVAKLQVFIEGFTFGLHVAQRSQDEESPPFRGFHDWLAARLGRRKNGRGWPEMLLESANGSEEQAFQKFWSELDAFRAASVGSPEDPGASVH